MRSTTGCLGWCARFHRSSSFLTTSSHTMLRRPLPAEPFLKPCLVLLPVDLEHFDTSLFSVFSSPIRLGRAFFRIDHTHDHLYFLTAMERSSRSHLRHLCEALVIEVCPVFLLYIYLELHANSPGLQSLGCLLHRCSFGRSYNVSFM